MSFVLTPGSVGGDPDRIRQRQAIANAMLTQGINTSPVQSWTQGAARLADALVGAWGSRKLANEEQTGRQQATDQFSKLLGGAFGTPSSSSTAGGTAVSGTAPASASGGESVPTPLAQNSAPIFSDFINTVKSGLTNPFGLSAVAATGRAESAYAPKNAYGQWSDASADDPNAMAGGIMSWNGGRLNNLKQFASAHGDDPNHPSARTQGLFFLQENPELINQLQGAKSVQEAQNIMNDAWRFRGYNQPSPEAARRLEYAQSYLPQFEDGNAVSSPAPAVAAVNALANGQNPSAIALPQTAPVPQPSPVDGNLAQSGIVPPSSQAAQPVASAPTNDQTAVPAVAQSDDGRGDRLVPQALLPLSDANFNSRFGSAPQIPIQVPVNSAAQQELASVPPDLVQSAKSAPPSYSLGSTEPGSLRYELGALMGLHPAAPQDMVASAAGPQSILSIEPQQPAPLAAAPSGTVTSAPLPATTLPGGPPQIDVPPSLPQRTAAMSQTAPVTLPQKAPAPTPSPLAYTGVEQPVSAKAAVTQALSGSKASSAPSTSLSDMEALKLLGAEPANDATGNFPAAPSQAVADALLGNGGARPPAGAPMPSAGANIADLAKLASNPWLTPGQRTVLGALIQQRLAANKPLTPVSVGAGSSLVDPRTGKVIYQAPQKNTYHTLSDDEAKKMGLPEGGTYQVQPNGHITKIGGSGLAGGDLSQDDAHSMAASIIDGTMDPNLPGFYHNKAAVYAEVKKIQPDFNIAKAAQTYKADARYFGSMNSSQQIRIRQNMDTLSQSLPMVKQLADQWDAGGFKPLNAATLAVAVQGGLGQKAQSIATQLQHQISQVNAELAGVFMGGNSPTDAAFKLAQHSLSGDWSAQTLRDNLKLIDENLRYRRNALTNAGAVEPGNTTSYGVPPHTQEATPPAVPAYQRGGPAEAIPGATPNAAPAQTAPQAAPTATNPKTGQKIQWNGQAWVPMQ